ncbi:hypothetical protein HaLaN_23386 [Haematococcus lacustris]|uniref:Uncharacterized protein n=1 Tax=Haematococcus lacustris TaxID=44745 RepID=A0A6A0A4E3_HAELA|nr:hypothetical protein HaLaN_23386 [Haematococcus lacustris]
MAWEDFGQKK